MKSSLFFKPKESIAENNSTNEIEELKELKKILEMRYNNRLVQELDKLGLMKRPSTNQPSYSEKEHMEVANLYSPGFK